MIPCDGEAPKTMVVSWERFSADLTELAGSPVQPETRIIEDLGLDSLALFELVVMLIDDYGSKSFEERLPDLVWKELTAQRLFTDYISTR